MEPRSGLPSFWVTHLAKVLVGEQPCLLQPWLQGRFTLPRRQSGDLADWKANHTELLQKTVRERADAGWKCRTESFFRVTGQHGIVSGKADLILQQADKRPRIVDCKSGKPKDSDTMQVMLEQVLIPLAWNAPGMQFEGEIVYANGNGIVLMPQDAAKQRGRIFTMIRELATMARPAPSPSRDSCLFCDVPDSECGQRWKEENDSVAVTNEF